MPPLAPYNPCNRIPMAWNKATPRKKGARQANRTHWLDAYRARRVSRLRQPLLLLHYIFALVLDTLFPSPTRRSHSIHLIPKFCPHKFIVLALIFMSIFVTLNARGIHLSHRDAFQDAHVFRRGGATYRDNPRLESQAAPAK